MPNSEKYIDWSEFVIEQKKQDDFSRQAMFASALYAYLNDPRGSGSISCNINTSVKIFDLLGKELGIGQQFFPGIKQFRASATRVRGDTQKPHRVEDALYAHTSLGNCSKYLISVTVNLGESSQSVRIIFDDFLNSIFSDSHLAGDVQLLNAHILKQQLRQTAHLPLVLERMCYHN